MIAPRLLIAGICLPFLFSGVTKLIDYDGAVAEFAVLGFPPGLFRATITLQLLVLRLRSSLRSIPGSSRRSRLLRSPLPQQ